MSKISKDKKKIAQLLERGVAEVINKKSLESKLLSGRQLRVKLGIDPTSPSLHLGRSIPLLKLRDFQQLGHKIVFIVGDFTATIGDTSDKDSERPMLTTAQVKQNLKTYLAQAGKIIDLKKTEVRYNSEWLSKLTYTEIGEQADQFSLAEFMARENISKRYKEGKRISLREILYPLMQGYDSVAIKADVELGGTDQRFNLLAGRTMQPHYGQKPQDLLMTNLIEGLDGRKMSSSWGNTINLTDSAKDMFGKIMSLRDELIICYFVHCTRLDLVKVEALKQKMVKGSNPRDIKIELAKTLVGFYFDKKTATKEAENFSRQFGHKEIPNDVPTFNLKGKAINLMDTIVITNLVPSKSEARRMFEQGAVKRNGEKVLKVSVTDYVKVGDVIQVGKRKFVKVV